MTDFLKILRQSEISGEVSDEELVNRMREGDNQAFELLYERYFQKMYAFVLRRVGNQAVAEDVVSSIFLKAFAHRRSFVWKASFSAWIYRIATNTVTDYYRTSRPSVELEEIHGEEQGLHSIANPEVEADHALLARELERLLEQLNERERLAITIKFYGEGTQEEIAKALGCTPSNAGVILHRALKKCERLAGTALRRMLERPEPPQPTVFS